MTRILVERREVLRGSVAGAALLAFGIRRSRAAPPPGMDPPRGLALGWRTRLAPAGEPGEPLIVTGTVFLPDGRTPAAGVTVYAYHTDARGLYAPGGETPRLRGWMVTNATGRFELVSIRPAPYPGRTIPAHVHFNAWSASAPRQWFEQLEFEGDPLLSRERLDQSRRLGRFGFVRPLTRAPDAPWRSHLALRLRERSNY